MKVIYIRYRTFVILICIVLIVLFSFFLLHNRDSKSKETFYYDDVFYKGNIDKKTIAFTCNVDWGNEYIPKILDIFRENNIKITFFVTGRWAENNSEILQQIYDDGHEIGNHGYNHRDYDKLSLEQNKIEIQKADKVIRDIIDYKPIFFAPPSGAYNDNTLLAANELGYEVIMWSIDTIDWRNDSTKEKIYNRVTSKVHNSAIVLMHPKEETVKALPSIIETLFEMGYKIGKVSDIISQ